MCIKLLMQKNCTSGSSTANKLQILHKVTLPKRMWEQCFKAISELKVWVDDLL